GVTQTFHECPNPKYMKPSAGRWGILPCRRRCCVYCGSRYWLRGYERRFYAGLADVDLGLCKVLTLTAPGSDVLSNPAAIAKWNLGSTSKRNRFEQYFTRLVGSLVSFYWVAELQLRGAIHFHGVARGVRWVSIPAFR